MSLEGRVAFITGATRGVGKALAVALARQGCDIVVTGKTIQDRPELPGTIFDTAAAVEEAGRAALAFQLDVRDDEAVARAVAATMERFGRLDILVNNAGALFWHPLKDTPLKRFDLVMGVNARGSFACIHHALPHMLHGGWGHILNMSPPVDPAGAEGKIAYAISKFGMTLIAHGLAGELRGTKVACNALWPATLIESYATITWGLGDRRLWRKPDILVDASLRILAKPPASFSGHALIDEDFLRAEGIDDFTRYRCDPDHEPPRVGFSTVHEAG